MLVQAFSAMVESEVGGTEAAAASVLVVDDDPSIRKLIIAALKRDGYVFGEANNGRDALQLMRSMHPSVVVLDLMMPIVSGWQVLDERQKDAELLQIPVILISANRAPEVAGAIDQGICAFLPKPFDIAVLSALVRSCLRPDGDRGMGLTPPA